MLPCAKGATALAAEGLFYCEIDIFANAFKIFMNFRIGYSYYCYPILFKKRCSFFVILFGFFSIMFRAVKLDYKLCFGRIEIGNVFSKHLLSRKANRVCS